MNAETMLGKMNLREKIAQTAIIMQSFLLKQDDIEGHLKSNPYGGITAKRNLVLNRIDEAGKTDITDKTDKATKEDKPDNDKVVKLCSEDYKAWFKEISKHLKINPIIAMDAEKGAKDIFDDMTMTAGAPALGAAASEELAYKIGECVAAEIKHAGVSWLWSPVVDLSSRFNSVNIGRVFSDSAELQKRLACAQIKGIQSKSVAAGVKHFPGTDLEEYRDAHITQTVISGSLNEWERSQGMIFQAAVDADAWSVMVGHVAFPAVDDTKMNGAYIPATLSQKIITGLLKNKMGFKGVVLTDSVVMAGLSTFYPREKLYVELLKAGNDALIGLAKPDYVDIVEKAVLSGELSEERINDACMRMLRLKEKTRVPTSHTDTCSVPESKNRIIERTHNVNMEIAEKALTLVCDNKNRLPFRKDEVKHAAIICSTHYDEFIDNLQVMKSEFEKRGALVSIQRRLKSVEECEQIANENDLIIYAAYLGAHRPMGASSFYGAECLTFMFALTHGKEKSIGISFGSPYIYYDFFTNADIFINAYHYNEEMQKAAVAAIYGEIPFKGGSPFKLMARNSY